MDNVGQMDGTLHYLEPPLFALNSRGRLSRSDAGAVAPIAGRGAAFGDLDNDGSLDVVETVLGGEPLLLRNARAGGNHWLTLSLQGTRSNRDGFGATVLANGQCQYVNSAGSYLSASDKRVHFGLGTAASATVDISWPSGVKQHLTNVRSDQFLTVVEPAK